MLYISIFCLLYGLFVFSAKSGSKFYLFWIGLGICLFLLNRYWDVIPFHGFILAIASICILVFLFVEGLIIHASLSKPSDNLDAIIVLGAQVHPYGPCRSLAYRLDAAKKYLDKHPQCICVVSGGQGDNEPDTEAAVMKEYLVKKGVDPNRIFEEDQSTSTYENLTFSKKFIKEDDHVGIATSNFHVYRSVLLAKKAGYKYVEGISAKSAYEYLLTNMVREFFALIKDKLVGNI